VGIEPWRDLHVGSSVQSGKRINLTRVLSERVLAEGRRQTGAAQVSAMAVTAGLAATVGCYQYGAHAHRAVECPIIQDVVCNGCRARGGRLLEQRWGASTGVGGSQRWRRSWGRAGPGYAAVVASIDDPVDTESCKIDGKGLCLS
jgi:hypothetical protein